MKKGLIGIQMSTIKEKIDELGAYGTLAACAKLGFHCVEISQIPMTPENVAGMKKACDDFEIKAAACTAALEPITPGMPGEYLTENFEKIVEDCKILNCDMLRIGMLPISCMGSQEKALDFVKRADEMAVKLRERGIDLYYHNHHMEFIKYGSQYLLDIIKDNTKQMGFELDIHWIKRGGEDPVEYIKKYAGRIRLLHLKDYRIGQMKLPKGTFDSESFMQTFANTVIGVALPLFVYYTDANGNSVLSGTKMSIAALACSICAVICYILCYNLTTERIKLPQKTEKFDMRTLLGSLVKNRALIGIVAASICLLLAQLTLGAMSSYIYPNYFGNIRAQSASGMVSTAVTLICATFTVKMSQKFGRKQLGIMSALFGAAALIIAFFLQTHNAWVFVGIYALSYSGLAVFSLICWAMITDVIDDTEVQTGERSDGTIYAMYSFARKLGQAASSGLTGGLLTIVGYTQASAYEKSVVNGIYNITCLVPAAGFILLAVILKFLYPLGKKRVDDNARILEKKHSDNATN